MRVLGIIELNVPAPMRVPHQFGHSFTKREPGVTTGDSLGFDAVSIKIADRLPNVGRA
jgi:hypothetical protein